MVVINPIGCLHISSYANRVPAAAAAAADDDATLNFNFGFIYRG